MGLDAGSGTGPYVRDVLALGHTSVALDLSFGMLANNRGKHAEFTSGGGVVFVEADLEHIPFEDGAFDWVLCTRVLSHARNLAPVLLEFSRVLRRQGECFITDVHPDHPYSGVTINNQIEDVALETHKHSLSSLIEAISEIGDFELAGLKEYYLSDLAWEPPREEFAKLYRYEDPAIFYTCRLSKK
jgi:ubiquinone/menaquinone biosynthesis C-methylase UbiE